MKNCRNILVLLIGGLLLFSPALYAKRGQDRIVWSSRMNKQTGLYTTKNYFVSHGVSISVNALYYFGDVDNEGIAFNGGFNVENLSAGGGLNFGYTLPIGNSCNLRMSLMAGTLRANNEQKFLALDSVRYDFRKFNSIIIQPSVGVEYYPISTAGLYLYAGLAVTGSIITNYEFWYNKKMPNGTRERTLVKGNTYGILPMIQLGIGYSWRLSQSWTLNAEIMVQEGLIDTHYMNLDAFPLASSQNKDGVELGKSFGKWTDRYGKEHIHWNDGWFQVGVTVSYRWRNCEHCRILNNYSNIRARRR